VVQPGQQRVEEPADVEHADGPGVDARLAPTSDLEQLVGRAEAARQRREAVRQVRHQRLRWCIVSTTCSSVSPPCPSRAISEWG
jgi:hypothetical protein